MSLKQIIKDDIARMKEVFPKLTLLNDDGKPPSFTGTLDVCDEAGDWHGSFDIRLMASPKYPYGVPQLFETGGLIERIADRHVNSDGSCCVAMDHVLLYRAARGMTQHTYLLEFAWPYFANQLYFRANGRYAAGEYAHGFEGIIQFYKETLHITDAATAKLLLSSILNRTLPLRNEQCLCGSNRKFKQCHMRAAEYLQTIGRTRLENDLSGFEFHQKRAELPG